MYHAIFFYLELPVLNSNMSETEKCSGFNFEIEYTISHDVNRTYAAEVT